MVKLSRREFARSAGLSFAATPLMRAAWLESELTTGTERTGRDVDVPPTLPVASHPDFLLNERTNDPLAARYPWYPEALYYGGPDSIGLLDVDWLWPNVALVDWDRDGLLDVVCGLGTATYSHRPKNQQYRTLVYLNTGKKQNGVPIFAEPFQVHIDYPIGSMCFEDIDQDGHMDLITQVGKTFRWYRDVSVSGNREFIYQDDLWDFGLQKDLELLEAVSMAPSIQVVDWDGDGAKDLIVGGRGGNVNYYPKAEIGYGKGFAADGNWVGGDRNGSVVFYKNLGMRNGKLCFSAGERLIAGADERAISYYDTATVVVTDWNDDGHLDLVVASFDNLYVFLNENGRLRAGQRIPVAHEKRLPFERVQVIEANWGPRDRHNLILQGSSFPWYLRNSGTPGDPRFDAIDVLQQKHPPVSAGDFAIPCVGDLNGDGKPDLVIGNEDGFLLYVENTSRSSSHPTFAPAVRLSAGGKVFRVETAHGMQGPAEARWGYTSPVLTDWDNDGDLDLIVSSSLDHFLLLENVGTARHPVYTTPQKLMVGDHPLVTVWRTRPIAEDIDGDGLTDLLALDTEGMLTLYRRYRNDRGQLALRDGERILDEKGSSIKLDGSGRQTGRATLTLTDWDNDGRPDLIVSNAVETFKGLRWYRNVGTKQHWVLSRQPDIHLNLPWNHYQLIDTVDWAGDGKTDLIVGSEGGWIYLYKQK